MPDAFWNGFFTNLGTTITAIGVIILGVLNLVFTYLSKRESKRDIQSVASTVAANVVERTNQIAEVKADLETTKRETFDLKDRHDSLEKVVAATNTFSAELLQKQISDFGKLK